MSLALNHFADVTVQGWLCVTGKQLNWHMWMLKLNKIQFSISKAFLWPLWVQWNTINVHFSVSYVWAENPPQSFIFCFCHLPTPIPDILVWVGLYLDVRGPVFACRHHAVFFTVCTPEPGNNLSKCPSVLDRQCTCCNYIHSCTKTVTPRGLNSLPPQRRLCNHPCLFVCLFVCQQDYVNVMKQFALNLVDGWGMGQGRTH